MKRITQGRQRANTGRRSAAWLMGVSLALGAVIPACSSSVSATVTGGCSLNSDCLTGLVCALGKCRRGCVQPSDCPVPGSSCIDDGRNAVCQAPAEKNAACTSEADCPPPLACASDYRCRNLCMSDADCNVLGIVGRTCAVDAAGVRYCADTGESTNGMLTTASAPGAPSTPVVEPEAGAVAVALPQGAQIAVGIGSNGGIVGVGGVTVSIPAGALNADVPVTIGTSTATGPSGTVSSVVEIGPTGLTFAQPITIAFNYTDSELGGLPPSDFAVETSTDKGLTWTPLSEIVVDVYAHTIAGQTMHLSPYVLVQQSVGGQPIYSDAGINASSDAAGVPATLHDGGGGSTGNGSPDGALAAGEDSGAAPGSSDATVSSDGSGKGAFADGGTASPPDAGPVQCPAGPNAPSLAMGNAMNAGTTLGGTPVNVIDGYATLVTNYNVASALYVAQLNLTFTGYSNPSGYFTAGAYVSGSSSVVVSAAPQSSKVSGPQYSQGDYAVNLGQLENRGPGSACAQSVTTAQCVPDPSSTLTIEVLTATEMIGSLYVPCSPVPVDGGVDQISVASFDIPVLEYGDGGTPNVPQCCLSTALP